MVANSEALPENSTRFDIYCYNILNFLEQFA